MKKIHIVALLIFCALPAIAQTLDADTLATEQVVDVVFVGGTPESGIYEIVQLDEQPQFPGGVNGLMEYLASHIVYPTECVEAYIQGKVLVRFAVFKDGTVGNVEIVKSVHPLLDAEAIRVVESMPMWTPGKLDGEPVSVWYTLPVNYKLQDNTHSTPILSERDQADFDNLLSLGNQALVDGNTNYAYQYFKECFNIKPWDFSLIEKIDSVLNGQLDAKEQFYDWAVKRMYREMENGNNYDGLIPHIVLLQEQLVSNRPNDLYTLGVMQDIYFRTNAFEDIISISDKIYPLIPNGQIGLLAEVLTKHAYALSHKEKNKDIINLIVPHLDKLFSQSEASVNTLPLLALLDAYFQLNDKKGAKQLLHKFKDSYPSLYTEDVDNFVQVEPKLKSFVEDALK